MSVDRACLLCNTFSLDLVILTLWDLQSCSWVRLVCRLLCDYLTLCYCSPMECRTEGRAVNLLEGMIEEKLSLLRSEIP